MKRDKGNYDFVVDVRRSTANARERNRMHNLNAALDRLRRHLPPEVRSLERTRLSKIDTLKVACNYIATLSEVLENDKPLSSAALSNCLRAGLSTPKISNRILKQRLLQKDQPHHWKPDFNGNFGPAILPLKSSKDDCWSHPDELPKSPYTSDPNSPHSLNFDF